MRRDGMNQTVNFHWMTRCLALFVALSAAAADTPLEAVKTAPEPAPQQPPPNNWFNVSTPGRSALANRNSFLQYGPPANNNCCPGRRCGHYLRRIIAWATYCPKYRVCSCTQWCNSCQYKGVVPFYTFFLNPKCIEGSGVQATFPNQCYRGYKDCTTCGHR